MEKIRLFEEDELENTLLSFSTACSKYGYEGAIIVADKRGGMRIHHCNVELELFTSPQHTIQWNRLSGKD